MKKYLNILFISASFFLMYACGDVDVNEATGAKVAPAQITNVRVVDQSGGAILYYDRPDDLNLKYVRAVFNPEPGIEKRVNASFYTDSIKIDGFKEAGEYNVYLYSVSYGEVASAPVVVKVKPDTPPYRLVADKLDLSATFSGLSVKSENVTGAELAIGVLAKNSEGKWEQVKMEYTKAKNPFFSARGFPSVPTDFGVFVRDRWNHRSDTVTINITPWPEIMCPKNLMKAKILPGDFWECHQWASTQPPNPTNKLETLWDDMKNTSTQPCYHSKMTDMLPQHFTVDLGNKYNLSRMVVYWRAIANNNNGYGYFFKSGHVRYFELWGSVDPNPSGEFDDTWFKIGDFESTRPSGSTKSQDADPLTDDDKALAVHGQEFMVPEGTPPVRYYRFKSLETWGKVQIVMINEIEMYGIDYVEK